MSRLEALMSSLGSVQAGRRRTEAGWSHSCERPASADSKPSAQTISVLEAISETTRGATGRTPLDETEDAQERDQEAGGRLAGQAAGGQRHVIEGGLLLPEAGGQPGEDAAHGH